MLRIYHRAVRICDLGIRKTTTAIDGESGIMKTRGHGFAVLPASAYIITIERKDGLSCKISCLVVQFKKRER